AASECLTHRDQSDPSCVDLLELVTVVTESVRNCAPGGHAACAACLVALPRYGSVEVRIAFAKNMSRQTRLVLGQYWPKGQREVEDRAMRRIRGGPEPAAVRFDDRAADRQSHAHAAGLRGEEGLEYSVHTVRVDPGAAVLHRYEHLIGFALRSDQQLPRPVGDGCHRVHPVDRWLDHYLVQLDAIA